MFVVIACRCKKVFCHIGVGRAYIRSYEFFLSDVITSSGAKKRFYDIVRVEGFLGYPLKVFVMKFEEYVVHRYWYSNRLYYVFPENFYKLFQLVYKLIVALYRFYDKDVDRVFKHAEEIANRCRDVSECADDLINERNRVEHVIVKRILRGRKALTTRFTKNTMRCRDLVQKYFPELFNPYVFMYRNSEELVNLMKKLFVDRVAEAYRRFAEFNSPILIAREGIMLIAKEGNSLYDFSIYVDDCVDSDSYALFKVVGAYKMKGYVYRVKWIALLGLDKLSNQIFLHYVPPTLVLHKVERCRLWLLNMVDDFARLREDNYVLIEV